MARTGARVAAMVAALLLSLSASPPGALSDALGVGRLNYAGYRRLQHCTAFIAQGGFLVTARHCLDVPSDARLHFLEAYDRGEWADHIELPVARFKAKRTKDLALACDAARPDGRGLAVAEQPPRRGEALEVWGYGAPRGHVLQRVPCPLKQAGADGTLVLACHIAGGASGGPVVRHLDGTVQVVGVVWASGPGGTLATGISPGLLASSCP